MADEKTPGLDQDVEFFCLTAAKREVRKLRDAIRLHRDQKGDDRCWMDDEVLYKTLPEGYTPPERDSTVELAHCQQYIASRHNPGTVYLSPEREIERLRERIAKLEAASPGD